MDVSLRSALLGLLPCALWLVWIRRKDVWEPEPVLVLARVFLLGCAAAWAVAVLRPRIEVWLPVHPGPELELADAFLVTALTEELAKLAAVVLGALWLSEWDEPMDGIVYGAAAALGFASLENAIYVGPEESFSLVVVRAFTANLAHVAFTSGIAFFLGLGKLRGGMLGLGLWGLAVAVVLHGIYDLFLHSFAEWSAVSLLCVLPAALAWLGLTVHWSLRHSPHRPRAATATGSRTPLRPRP